MGTRFRSMVGHQQGCEDTPPPCQPRGGWIAEIQVTPKEVYELMLTSGHSGDTKYRFIFEARTQGNTEQY